MTTSARTLKAVSWNIAEGQTFSGTIQDAFTYDKEDLDYFISELSAEQPDIIGLQEARTTRPTATQHDQPQTIAAHLGMPNVVSAVYGHSGVQPDHDTSLGTVSRYPIHRNYFHVLPNPHLTVTHPNGVVWKTFDVGVLITEMTFFGTVINVANCHLTPYHYFKRNFAEPAFAHIRQDVSTVLLGLCQKPTVVLGDFNVHDLPKLLPELFAGRTAYREAFTDTETAPGKGQQDHILFSHHWHLVEHNVQRRRADHALCSATLRLATEVGE